ncbi:class I SAM-dependent methyltransferase [Campylobacter mucosalis]|uniref:SAM-dependent methyltransferase n=1 Tax=Campylobacter mucosalis CCUG 21559 TaxID=1032067 RepID=A0A6G5QH47_9BACT|nr:class I SAM-dependent methyltransferase [Campylobacter mucosalis]QCD44826.1 SAM-dependent methyltransferase [Campylobacter mucosalis CCUG 21559]
MKNQKMGGGYGLIYWDKNYQNSQNPTYPVSYVTDFAFSYLKSEAKVLDLGCGAGRHVSFLAQNGFKAYGCDYSKDGIKSTQNLLKSQNLSADLKVCNMLSLPYEDEFFDGLINYGVLMYAGSKERILRAVDEIYRVLKTGGVAFFQFRNFDDDRYKTGILKSKYEVIANQQKGKMGFDENSVEIYYFDKDEVKRIFNKFEILEINEVSRSYDNDSYKISYFLVILKKGCQ